MNQEERMNSILSKLTACNSKRSYLRDELPDELQNLINQFAQATYNDVHAENGQLGLKAVKKHLTDENIARGNVADVWLEDFKIEANRLSTDLNAIKSGYRGEAKAFAELEKLKCFNKVVTNVELNIDGVKTEIDAIVITTKCIYIVEVKNTAQDVEISESGNYYRICGYRKIFDSPILEKQQTKEELLRKALESKGIKNIQIKKVVVFTTPNIYIVNECERLETVSLDCLTTYIESNVSDDCYTDEDIKNILFATESSRVYEAYPLRFNPEKIKRDFAMVMVLLEDTEDKEGEILEVEQEIPIEESTASSYEKKEHPVQEPEKKIHWKSAGIGWSVGIATTVACAVILKNTKILKAI